jgi:hypothetical protein
MRDQPNQATSTDVRMGAGMRQPDRQVDTYGYGEEPPAGWEGLTVSKWNNPYEPWATVVRDWGGESLVVMPWDFWRNKEPVKEVKRVGLVVYVPNKR